MDYRPGKGRGSTSLLGWVALVLIVIGAIVFLFNTEGTNLTPAPAPGEAGVGGVQYEIP